MRRLFGKLLGQNKIIYQREFLIESLAVNLSQGNRVDFFIDNSILLDLKAKKFITKADYYQMKRYLQASNLELGLIINFWHPYLKPKRVLRSVTNNTSYS
ncbi:MAG TPA: hypothetical protein DCY49_02335 [Candidatus Jacksonbacteria bacterium]|nr:hypothetical protein [Candidatus Jacksonbacteria bacterium]